MNKSLTKVLAAFIGMAMAIGVGVAAEGKNIYRETKADTATIAYTTNSTTNMTGSNDAATLGLSATHWSVVGAKGSNNNFPGLNKSKYIALYYHADGSNTITVTSLDSYTISSIVITYTSSDYNNGLVKVGNVTKTDTDDSNTTSTHSIDSTSFVITNGNTSNVQVRISNIVITYSTGAPAKEIINKTIIGPADMAKELGDEPVNISNQILVDGNPLNGCTVTSSNTNVVTVNGTILTFAKAGQSTITISHTDVEDETTITKYADASFKITVSLPLLDLPEMPDGDYEKITSKTNVTSGYYLIVKDTAAFKASAETLDSSGNSVEVSDNEGVITASAALNSNAVYLYALGNYSFYILAHLNDAGGYVYMGRTANSNGLDQSQTEALTNTLVSITDGVAKIQASGSKFFGFTSSKFRYYAESNGNVSLYKKVSTAPVEDVYTTSISVSPKTASVPLGSSVELSATIDQNATVRTITWTADPNNSGVSVAQDGTVSVAANAVVGSTATITASVHNGAETTIQDTAVITVGEKKLTGLSFSGYRNFYAGQSISDYEGGVITASWTAGDNTTINLNDVNLTVKLGGNSFAIDTPLTAEDNGKQIQFTYEDPNYADFTKSTSNVTITVGPYFELHELVAAFTESKNYVLVSDANSKINFDYVSWGGKATATVSSSNEAVAEASIATHTFSTRNGSGAIALTPHAQGTAVITLNVQVEETILSKSLTVLFRTEDAEQSGTTNYQQLNYVAPASLQEGNYIIGAHPTAGYKAMSNESFTQPITASDIAVSQGVITTEDVSGFVVSITKNNSNDIAIKSGNNYLTFSGNNVASTTTATYLSLSQGVNGTFRIKANSDATRALCFRVGFNFRSYAISNITDGSEDYYDIELFREVTEGGEVDDVTVVQNFVNSYMHPNISDSNREDTGACYGTNGSDGYYATAKSHLQSDLTAEQRLIFRDTFTVYYNRMIAWGIKCREDFSISNSGEIVTSVRQSNVISIVANGNYNIPIAIVIASIVGFTAIGAFFFIKKRKEQ